jgi:hypothetical protein
MAKDYPGKRVHFKWVIAEGNYKAYQVVRHESLGKPLRNPLSEKFNPSSSYE